MNREDIAFFKSRQGYRRIFEGIREKYKSLGRIGGVIKLTDLTDKEKEILSNHFKRDYSRNKSANIHFWRYTVDDYKKAQSSEILSDRRLNILKSIEAFSLREIIEEMNRIKKAGYQELIIDELISDLFSISCFKKV